MSVAPARRTRSAPAVVPRQRGHRRSLRATLVVALLVAAALLLLSARVGILTAGPGQPQLATARYMTYTIVAGDTPSSVASAYSLDARDIARQSGSAGVESLLGPGLQLRINAVSLWAHVSQGRLAANENLVVAAARRFGVEPSLALAVAWQESRLNEAARSSTGAVGIMQVEPETSKLAGRDLGVPIDATNAQDNVVAGVFWLHSLLASYRGDQSAALAAYYEGPGNLARRGYLRDTAGYVAHAQQLRRALLIANPALGD